MRTQLELKMFGFTGPVDVGVAEIRGMKTEEGQDGFQNAERCCKWEL